MDFYSLLRDVEERKFIVEYDENYVKKATLIKYLLDMPKEKKDIPRGIKKEDLEELQNLTDEEFKKVQTLDFKYICKDNLRKYLDEEKSDCFYYIGINQFVLDYYNSNPNSIWKIKAVFQLGFPFGFVQTSKWERASGYNYTVMKSLENKSWSLFVFSKESLPDVVLGFDDRNTYANLQSIKEDWDFLFDNRAIELGKKEVGAILYETKPTDEMRDQEIIKYLKTGKLRDYTKEEIQELGYSFIKISADCFKIEYLEYLSRYKKSVMDIFGPPDKKEKIKPLKTIVRSFKKPWGDDNYLPSRESDVYVDRLFFHNGVFKPIIRVGTEYFDSSDWFDPYEICAYDVSPYYFYCLLSSELVRDYYSERYMANKHSDYLSSVPLEECIYIQMSSEKMNLPYYKNKYELDINPRLTIHNLLESKTFVNQKAKEAIDKFLVEINDAIKNGLYYSATIVIGSVLEAFLIDWLSEIDNKDYMEEDYLVIDKKTGHERRANLIDYIDIIEKKYPHWISGIKKDKFDLIRKKRNLVHPKLYISEGEISSTICNELLENLKIIVNNRWKK